MKPGSVRLVDLNPHWVGYGGEGVFVTATGEQVPRREKVGVSLDCPCGGKCGQRPTWLFENPQDGGPPLKGTTWKRTGETFETLTLRPSLLRRAGCKWHGYLTNGILEPC